MRFRKLLLVTTGWLALVAAGQSAAEWFTVVGDPEHPDRETVQVDPVAVHRGADTRTMHVRVNRATARTSWEGVPYRSYEARVMFHCAQQRAEYLRIDFYRQPLWQDQPHQSIDYALPPPMLFKDMTPNPTQRIVRAACTDRDAATAPSSAPP